MNIKEQINKVWDKWEMFKRNAEQSQFVSIFKCDLILTPRYNDLCDNFDENHAQQFITIMETKIFPYFKIK